MWKLWNNSFIEFYHNFFLSFPSHPGGNQRDLARAKNLKKNQDAAAKKNDDGLTPQQRRER